MHDAKPSYYPAAPGVRLSKEDPDGTTKGNEVDATHYRSMVGKLVYLMVGSEPSIAFAVGQLSRFFSCPVRHRLEAAKLALRYKTKTAQLVLYKKFLSEQFGYPLDRISTKYFIVKRKLTEGMMFAQKRVQTFEPANGKPTLNKITKSFEDFVRNSFNEDGSHRRDSEFPAMTGKNGKNCKWCPFKNDEEACPKGNRHKV